MSAAPGQPSVARRVGTAATFAAAMKARLTRAGHPLTSRSPDDPAIALVDAWAEVLDVLAFYSGRIADEGYLRTAAEPLSLAELARAVGYAPGRGRAASALLTFTLDDSPGSPRVVPVPRGTRVASLPGPGQLPQTYETTEDLQARPEWNAVPARSSRPQEPAAGDAGVYVEGARPDLRPGDAVLLVGREREQAAGSEAWAFRLLSDVEHQAEPSVTWLRWTDPLGEPPEHSGRSGDEVVPAPPDARLHVLRQRAGIFGAAAPDHRLIGPPSGTQIVMRQAKTVTTSGPDWPGWSVEIPGQPPGTVDLDAVYPGVVAGSWVVLSRPGAVAGYRVHTVQEVSRTDYTLNAKVTRLRLDGPSVGGLFGAHVRQTTAHVVSELLPLATEPEPLPVGGEVVRLDRTVPALPGGRTVVVRGPRPVLRVAEGVHDLVVSVPGAADLPLRPGEELEVVAVRADARGPVTWHTARGAVTAGPDRLRLVPPPGDATVHSEIGQVLAPGPGAAEVDELRLTGPLTGCYDPATVRVLANVADGGHGESHTQVLGSGDASRGHQRLQLAKAPLTYRAGAGGEVGSTLQVRVDGRLWNEVPRLFGTGPHDEVFVTEVDGSGQVAVRFGDGLTGARLPTGSNNVTATYRVGTGLAGRVGPGQLGQLMTRPLGVRSVTNPQAAGTAADAEPAEEIRAGTARTALTLERVVSLRDVQEFARAVPGIGKALAARVWDGRDAVVHLTVAGPLGEVVDEQALADLAGVVRAAGVPRLPLTVQSAEVVPVRVAATVVVDLAHDAGPVLDAVSVALTEAASAAARAVGEPFRLGRLVLAAHGVPGVVAVRIGRPERDLPALAARVEHGVLAPAQLVCLQPDGLELLEVTS